VKPPGGGFVIMRQYPVLYLCSAMKNSVIIIIAALFVFVHCKPGQVSSSRSLKIIPADLLGNFNDDYDIRYTITGKTWTQHPNAIYHLLSYDTAGKFFIAKNDSKNPSDPGLYSRIDIMRFSNMEPWRWGFCLTKYNAKTMEEAIAVTTADRANPKKGCGGYPFSRMKRE
jgi:hypothetical protein